MGISWYLAHLMVSSHVYNASVPELVKTTHVIDKLLSGEYCSGPGRGWHSVLEWVSMCVRNLSERVLFRSGMSYSDHSIWVSKSTKMWKGLYFTQKPGIKWCKKGCFFPRYVTQKGVYFFNFGTTKLGCFFQRRICFPKKSLSAPSPPHWVFWLRCI